MNLLKSQKIANYIDCYTGLPKQCWSSIALTLLQSLVIGICYFISLYLINTLHINIATTGLLLSCYGAGTIAGGYISGRLADYFPCKWIALLSLLIEAFSFIFLSHFTSVSLLIITLFILGLSSYGFKTSNDIWLLDQCKNDVLARMKAVNISRAAMNLGLGISGIIIGIFAQYGFHKIFYFFSLTLFMACFFLLSNNRDSASAELSNSSGGLTKSSVTQQFNLQIIMLTLFCLFCVGLMIAQLGTTYPIYVMNAFPALGMKAVSILYLLDTFLIVLTQVPLTNFLRHYNKIHLLGVGAILMGIGMFILSLSSFFILAIFSCLVWTTGEMIFMPMAQLLCYENGGQKKKGHSMGLFQATYALSAVIGPSIGGFIYYHANGNVVWYLCAALGVLSLTACLYFNNSLMLSSSKHANTAA